MVDPRVIYFSLTSCFACTDSGVGFVKIHAHCTLTEGGVEHSERLKGICFLKGDTVAVLVGLYCEDGTVHSLLVEQPR